MNAEPVGLLWTWWKADSLPLLRPISSLWIEATATAEVIARAEGLTVGQVSDRYGAGHCSYVAVVGPEVVAFGWCARREAAFGPRHTPFTIPERNRYLFDFVTDPAWRGRGIYPRLLQAMLQAEADTADRCWILHWLDNAASARGIAKAGFTMVGHICALDDGFGLTAHPAPDRAQAGADLLGMPPIKAQFPLPSYLLVDGDRR